MANKPPIKMPFRKVENCNQVVKIGKQLKFSLVNIAGNDIVQGNKKLILAYLWQLMRFNMLQLLKYLRSSSLGKEFTDADILDWANTKVRSTGSQTCMKSFKDKSLSDDIFFLELLSVVQPRVVNWRLVTKGQTGMLVINFFCSLYTRFKTTLGRGKSTLLWMTRLRIAEGTTRGLAYLYEEMDFRTLMRYHFLYISDDLLTLCLL